MKLDIQKGLERAIWFLPIFFAAFIAMSTIDSLTPASQFTFLGMVFGFGFMFCSIYSIFTFLFLGAYVAVKFFWRGFSKKENADGAYITNKRPIIFGLCISITFFVLLWLAGMFLPRQLITKADVSKTNVSKKNSLSEESMEKVIKENSPSDSEILSIQSKIASDAAEEARLVDVVESEIRRINGDLSNDCIAKIKVRNNNSFPIKSIRVGFYFFSQDKNYLERACIKDVPFIDVELNPVVLSPGASGVYSCRIANLGDVMVERLWESEAKTGFVSRTTEFIPTEADLANTKIKVLKVNRA